MYVSNRYHSYFAKSIDQIAFLAMTPWLSAASNFVSCYISTVEDRHSPQKKLADYFIFGPLYAVVTICLLPVGCCGIIMWMLICLIVCQDKYTYLSFTKNAEANDSSEGQVASLKTNVYALGSVNVLLGPECVGRLNNIKDSYTRTLQIAAKIIKHSNTAVFNISCDSSDINSKQESVHEHFPELDFLCLQEVWTRSHAFLLINLLKEEFQYFLYDVAEYSWSTNMFLLGSGLMFASKWPILDADFKPFLQKTKHAKLVCQGVLCVKVLLGFDEDGYRHVGYVTNLHTQAFQGKNAIIAAQLSEARLFIACCKMKLTCSEDIIDLDVICGDLNADNMSPGDIEVQHHLLLSDYEDFCAVKPGLDKPWAIGTELRQMTMLQPEASDPTTFKEILVDDAARRLYVLDADVMIHSPELMTKLPQLGVEGSLTPVPHGGMRRVDRILVHKDCGARVLGYCFLSALAGLTDHLPVCITLESSPPSAVVDVLSSGNH